MTLPLTGRTIALAETRQLEDLAQMLENEGATTVRCPMFSILDAPDEGPVLAWLRELIAGRFDCVVLFTGEGLRRLLGFADRADLRQEVIDALKRSRTITRGPKPVKALKEVGLAPTVVAEAPTTDGVIASLKKESIAGKTIGVQFYSESNPPLEEFLKSAGAEMAAVLPYVYAPAADAEEVAGLIRRMSDGDIDALVLTSSPQVDRLYDVASMQNLDSELAAGLQKTRVAAVGPVVAENLRKRGAPVHICPEKGFVMKNLVKQIKIDLARSSAGSG